MALAAGHPIRSLVRHKAWSLSSINALKVYIKLLVLVEQRGPLLKATNAELHEVARSATRSIAELEEAGLIEVMRDPSDGSRTIRVK
jgi:DNA-binding MarR family transcriptional regulator